jgi:DNA-binding beta-propeller fold protein YncE
MRSSQVFGCRGVTALLCTLSAATPATGQQRPDVEYYVYVAAESQDEVALVRFGPSGTVVLDEVAVGLYPSETDGPHGIAVDPGRSKWYVSIAHGQPFGQVHRYSTGTNRPEGRVDVGLFPATMVVSPGGILYVANFNLHGDRVPSSVSVVDTDSMEEVARVTTCAMPHGSRLSPDGRWHYSVCMLDDQLVEIDTRSLEVSRRMSLAPGAERRLEIGNDGTDHSGSDGPGCAPTWVQPAPGRHAAYVACNRNREVLEVDLDDWTIARRFETGAGPYNLDVTPNGAMLVVTYKGDAAVGVFDLASGGAEHVVPTARRIPHGVVVTPDSRYAFVTIEGVGNEPGTVEVIDLGTKRVVGTVEVGRQAGGIGFWKMERP